MHIIELLDELRSKQAYYGTKNEAFDMFRKQAASIQAIRESQGYIEIKNYRKREIAASVQRLKTTKKWELPAVQAELNIATNFLDFLENLEIATT